jgi:outer membrane protein OmpA-like peptidoglycan-associated protein
MPGNITFQTNQSAIQSNFYSVLDSVLIVFNKFNDTFIEIEGHTDSTGGANYNLNLSEKRARSVSDYFTSKGISRGRISHFGRGSSRPVASNQSTIGRSQNRRVEIRIKAR